MRLAGLGNRFLELIGRRLDLPRFAAETARLVARSMRVRGVAILGYDSSRKRLSCLATEGLDEPARQALGGDGECPWEIPLRGLYNRRISVIASAQQNPFVPRPLAALSPRALSIASLPVYDGHQPVGVVLLFGVGNQAFPDSSLRSLVQALRVCAPGLREREHDGGDEITPAADAAVPATQAPGSNGTSAAASTPPESSEPLIAPQADMPEKRSEPSPELESKLSQALEELERSGQTIRRLTASGNTLKRERDVLVQQLAELERTRETDAVQARSEVNSLQDRLLASESERARQQRFLESQTTSSRQTIAALETERQDLEGRAAAAESSLTEVENALRAVRAEREELSGRSKALEAKLQGAQESLLRTQQRQAEEREVLEADRDAWQEQTASVRSELQRRSEALAELERTLRATTVQRDAATQQLEGARREIEGLVGALEEAQGETAKLESARATAAAETESLRAALQEEKQRLRADAERLQRDLADAGAHLEQQGAELTTARGELKERDEILQRRNEELASTQRARQAAEEAEAAARDAQNSLRADLTTLATQLEQATAERQKLLDDRERLRAAVAEERRRAVDAESARVAAERQSQTGSEELRLQVDELTAAREELAGRLRESEEGRRAVAVQRAEAVRRSDMLGERLKEVGEETRGLQAQLDEAVAKSRALATELEGEREQLRGLRAKREEERQAREEERQELRKQLHATRDDLQREVEETARLKEDRERLSALRDSTAEERRAALQQLGGLEKRTQELEAALTEAQAAAASAAAESDALRVTREEDRVAAHREAEGLRAAIQRAEAQAEEAGERARVLSLQGEQHERRQGEDAELIAALRAEVADLQQKSVQIATLEEQVRTLTAARTELEREKSTVERENGHVRSERDVLAEKLIAADSEREALQGALADAQRERDDLIATTTARAEVENSLRTELVRFRTEREELASELQKEREARQDAAAHAHRAEEALREENEALVSKLEALQEENSLLREQRAATERELQSALEGQGQEEQALVRELEAARREIARLDEKRDGLEAELTATQRRLRQVESTTVELEQREAAGRLKLQEEGERAVAAEQWCEALAHVLAQVGQQNDGANAALGAAREEIRKVRAELDETAGLAAREAKDLGDRCRELEAERSVLETRLDDTETARETLATELQAEQKQHAEALADVGRERDALQQRIEQLLSQSQRLAAAEQGRTAEAEAQANRAAQLERELAALREESERATNERAEAQRLLTENNEQIEDLTDTLRARDLALREACTERDGLRGLVDDLRTEKAEGERVLATKEAEQRTLESRLGDALEEVRSLKEQVAELADASGQAEGVVARLQAEHAAAVEQLNALRQTLDRERGESRAAGEVLRGDLEAARLEAQWLAAQVEELRAKAEAFDTERAELRRLRDSAIEEGRAEREGAEGLRTHLSELENRLEESEAEGRRALAERASLERQLAAGIAARGEREQALIEELRVVRQEGERWRLDCAELRAALEEAQQQAKDAGANQSDVRQRMRAEMDALREESGAIAGERDSLSTRLGEAERRLATRERELARAQEDSADLATRCAQAERSVNAFKEERKALEEALGDSRRELDSLRGQQQESDVLERRCSELVSHVAKLEERLAAARDRAVAVEAERDQAATELEDLRTHESAGRTAAEHELASLRAAVQGLEEERNRLLTEVAARGEQLDARKDEMARAIAELDDAVTRATSAEESQANLEERLRGAQEQIRDLSGFVRQRDKAVRAASEERSELERALRLSQEKLAALTIEYNELRQRDLETGDAAGEAEIEQIPVVSGAPDEPLAIERTEPVDEAEEEGSFEMRESPEAADVEPVPEEEVGALALLDVGARTEEALAVLRDAGFEVSCDAPSPESIKGLAGQNLACIMLNLASGPAAWQTLKALRSEEATHSIPVLAYLMPPDAQKGFSFGRADFDFWPMDPARATRRLEELRPRLRRVLAVSADIDGMGRLREPLAEANISASIVLDGKQALELASILNPEAAVLHLSPSCTGVGRAIAGLRAQEATRDAPFLVLLDPSPPREELFFSRTVRELLSEPNFEFKALPEEIARLLA